MDEITSTLGLDRFPPFYRDTRFLAALAAGALFWLGLGLWEPIGTIPPGRLFSQRFIVLAFGWPLVEEFLFRGILQGELRRWSWGSRGWRGVTVANLATSFVFTALHFGSHPPLWAAGVMVPSLLFGYFRDRTSSVYPSMALHVYYNFGYFFLTGLP
ncbi:MAG TPA: JDVT-CTERM system glutamic-type intramembrane protease [Nitrospiria bacterium]|nr:JDVT-CTERM system glutamic-type intramembrane protease [Nitrospiria bacterium]